MVVVRPHTSTAWGDESLGMAKNEELSKYKSHVRDCQWLEGNPPVIQHSLAT